MVWLAIIIILIIITIVNDLIVVTVMAMMNAASKTALYRENECLRAENNEKDKQLVAAVKNRKWADGE